MRITFCADVGGGRTGETATVDDDRGRWLVTNGYAVVAQNENIDDDDRSSSVAPPVTHDDERTNNETNTAKNRGSSKKNGKK